MTDQIAELRALLVRRQELEDLCGDDLKSFLAASDGLADELWPRLPALLDCAEVLAEIVGCPQGVDEATIPAGGVDVRPEQVVVNISVSLVRLRRAQAALARLNGESDADP